MAVGTAVLGAAGDAAAIGWPGADTYRRGARPMLAVNQIGYRTGLPKRAFLVNAPSDWPATVALVDANSEETIVSLEAGVAQRDEATGDRVSAVDFSALDREGRYRLRHASAESATFAIGAAVYDVPLAAALHALSLQRCGPALRDPVTGLAHGRCHQEDGIVAHDDGVHRAGDRIDAVGGWHDAGDYGKYVATTAVTVGRLLDAHLRHGGAVERLPLLDEARIGLDWLAAMQRTDGAVHRKLAGATWPGTVLPEADRQPRFVYGVSTPETAKAAAALAMGARAFRSVDPAAAASWLAAARRAWSYLERNPTQIVDLRPGDDDGSGRYVASDLDPEESLTHDRDDRSWAAAELYLATGERRYGDVFASLARRMPWTPFEWKDPSSLGLSAFLLAGRSRDRWKLAGTLGDRRLERAKEALVRSRASGYGLANDRFVWGSNKLAAEEGIILLEAHAATGRRVYLEAAVGQLDWIFGRNPLGLSFVTGFGENAVRFPTHRFAEASGRPIPGLMVGGPNSLAQDGIAPLGLGPLSHVDDARSYSTNENAIDYNASLIGLFAGLVAATA